MFLISLVCTGFTSTPLEEFKSAAEKIHTLKADFVQEKHLKILSSPLISTGLFRYQAPDSFRWEYRSPIKNLVLMQAGDLSRYEWTERGFQKITGHGFQGIQGVFEEITRWLKGDFDRDGAFRVSFQEDEIVLNPREEAFRQWIHRIVLALSERPGVIQSVTLHEGADSYTRITFKDVQVNADLSPSCFRPLSLGQDPIRSHETSSVRHIFGYPNMGHRP